MTKRICWKKGMRLTDDILRASDNCTVDYVGNALALAAAGRFGLLPSSTPFEISVDISQGIVAVESLNCLAITKDGHLIDVHYDTKFTNTFDTRVSIPENINVQEYILAINANEGLWNDTNDGFEEPVHSFSLFPANSPVPAQSMPIAHLVNDYGWRLDDISFVPPCLFVSSHPKFIELKQQFHEVLSSINSKAMSLLNSRGKEAIRIFWPIVQQIIITIDKESELMTPMMLLSNVQKLVSAFTCACKLDDNLELSDAETFNSYIFVPYNYKDVYQKIKEGLDLCFSISTKLGMIDVQQPKEIEAPSIMSEDLIQECMTKDVSIPIFFSSPTAKLFYTVDGSNPTEKSLRAHNTRNGFKVVFENGFKKIGKEPDKTIILKIVAIEDGEVSPIATYKITLKKSLKFRDARPI